MSTGAITVGTAFLLFQYVLLLSRPLEDVVDQLETVQKANGAMVRVIDLLAVRPDIIDDGRTSPPPGPLAVDFIGVSFDYGDDETVLHRIDLNIAAGRSVGVVGRTGSGKTTSRGWCCGWSRPRRARSSSAACPSPTSRWPSSAAGSR